jgi:phenylacetate-CoA ligase
MDIGLKTAIQTAQYAVENVPAYKQLLKKHGYPLKVKTSREFYALPVLDKKNYIASARVPELWDQKHFPAMTYASSGSTGVPTFWFRGDEEERHGAEMHRLIFSEIFGIKPREKTLVIICFSMGIWVAGGFTLSACRDLSRMGYHITSVTPGIEKGDIFSILKKLAPYYENVVIAGYPSFVMDIVKEAGDKLPKGLKILTAGDKFSENFRDRLLELTKQKDPLHTVVSLYGSADAGSMAFETPLSIYVRRYLENSPAFKEKIFGSNHKSPALLQYNPKNIFFEAVGKELILTTKLKVPLIRYNIHDLGKCIPYATMIEMLKSEGVLDKVKALGLNKWRLPFLIQDGRTDVALTFYALNILPEHFEAALNNQQVKKYATGSYFATSRTTRNHTREVLEIALELKPGNKPKTNVTKIVTEEVCRSLESVSIEYRKLHQTLGKISEPKIYWVENGSLYRFSHRTDSGLLSIQGKKPKIIRL